jgi:hypothetical protein
MRQALGEAFTRLKFDSFEQRACLGYAQLPVALDLGRVNRGRKFDHSSVQ